MKWILMIAMVFTMPMVSHAEEWTGEAEAIQDPGTYYVEVSTLDEDGDPVVTLVKTIVTTSETVINDEEAIDGHSFQVQGLDLSTVSDSDLIALAKVKAWNVQTGENIPITKVIRSEKSKHTYSIRFETEKGTSIVIEALMITEDSPMKWTDTKYSPNSFEQISNRLVELSVLALLAIPVIIIVLINLYIGLNIKKVENILFRRKYNDEKTT